MEKVKQEIFSRNYNESGELQSFPQKEEHIVPEQEYYRNKEDDNSVDEDKIQEIPLKRERKSHRWSLQQEKELVGYFQAGMTIEQLAKLFGKDEDAVKEKLAQKGIMV